MIDELMEHCKEVIFILEVNYSKQINYDGVIREIYNEFNDMIQKVENEDIYSINTDFFSIIRQFVDDTTEFNSPVIIEIEEVSKILDKIKDKY